MKSSSEKVFEVLFWGGIRLDTCWTRSYELWAKMISPIVSLIITSLLHYIVFCRSQWPRASYFQSFWWATRLFSTATYFWLSPIASLCFIPPLCSTWADLKAQLLMVICHMFNERFSPTHGQVRLQASLEGSPGWWHIHLGRMNLRFSFRPSGWSRKSSKERSFLAWCDHFCFDALELEDSMEAWEEQNVEWSPKCHVNAQDAFCFCLKAGWTCSILRVLSCRPISYGIMSMYLYVASLVLLTMHWSYTSFS